MFYKKILSLSIIFTSLFIFSACEKKEEKKVEAQEIKKVEVQVSYIKDIKKIPDSKPGLVSVTQYTSVYVEPIEDEINQWIRQSQVK